MVFTIDQCSKPLAFFIRLVSHVSSWGDPRTSHMYIYRIHFLSSLLSKSPQHSLAPRVSSPGPLARMPGFQSSVLSDRHLPQLDLPSRQISKLSCWCANCPQPLPRESAALEVEPCRANRGKQNQDISPFSPFFRGPFSHSSYLRVIFSWLCPLQCSRIWVALRLNQEIIEGKKQGTHYWSYFWVLISSLICLLLFTFQSP